MTDSNMIKGSFISVSLFLIGTWDTVKLRPQMSFQCLKVMQSTYPFAVEEIKFAILNFSTCRMFDILLFPAVDRSVQTNEYGEGLEYFIVVCEINSSRSGIDKRSYLGNNFKFKVSMVVEETKPEKACISSTQLNAGSNSYETG